MDLPESLAAVFPAGDASLLVPLSQLGYRDTVVSDDELQQVCASHGNVVVYLKQMLRDYWSNASVGESTDVAAAGEYFVLMDLLKAALDARHSQAESTTLAKDAVPLALAYVVLGASAQVQDDTAASRALSALSVLLRAGVALAVKELSEAGRRKAEGQRPELRPALKSALRLPEAVTAFDTGRTAPVDIIGGVVTLLTSSLIHLLSISTGGKAAAGGKAVVANLDIGFLLATGTSPNIPPHLSQSVRRVLECLPEEMLPLVAEAAGQRTAKWVQMPVAKLFSPDTVFATGQVKLLTALVFGVLAAAPVPAERTVDHSALGSLAINRLLTVLGASNTAKDKDWEEADDEDEREWKQVMSKSLSRAQSVFQQAMPNLPYEEIMGKWLRNVVAKSGDSVTVRVPQVIANSLSLCGVLKMPQFTFVASQMLIENMKNVVHSELINMTEAAGALEEAFMQFIIFKAVSFELDTLGLLDVVLPSKFPLALKGKVLGACWLSLWNQACRLAGDGKGIALKNVLKQARDNLIKHADFNAFVLDCRQALVNGSENRGTGSSVGARQCMSNLFSLLGSEYVFSLPAVNWSVTTCDILTQDYVTESGLWVIEALMEGRCEGGLDLSSIQVNLLPVIKWCEVKKKEINVSAKTAVLVQFYNDIAFQVKMSLGAFLVRVSEPEDCAALVCEILTTNFTALETVGISNCLRMMYKSIDQQVSLMSQDGSQGEGPKGDGDELVLIRNTWQSVFDWAQQVMRVGIKNVNGTLVSAGRDLLAVVCGIVPQSAMENLVGLLIQSIATLTVDEEIYSIYVELVSILIEQNSQRLNAQALLQLTNHSLAQLQSAIQIRPKPVAACRAWHHVLTRLLEAWTLSKEPSPLMQVMEVVYVLREHTDATLWKTRMQVLEALVRELHRTWKSCGDPQVLITFLFQGPLFEACWKAGSQTSVTRRRARRVLDKLVPVINEITDGKGLDIMADFLMLGMSISECISLQKGFIHAAEHVCANTNLFAGEVRSNLETILSMVKPMCFNLDKKSTHSSVLGSRFSRSTRFTSKSRKSIRSRFTPLRT
ncbi:hypothetical protein GNI_164430 [Gregarina niphandrodes]|uniref:Uncharacterized protein n=1 Tax=Gregarina niphandrodes TaxID=110365 RepID=A0A023AZ73_GRENI|nr:hypothetical protein GNI_164430 [Gregarina niphandrodes]EZG43620.1 hypothetical protein GNI_164430 [Gregarina niphandrodes]|eukprot:XP_011133148.1 hypothetical protein GNI_164430 [Gregarina niphandrodes]